MITPRLMTLSELDEAAPEREWGPWTLDAENFVLDNAVGYDIARKTWADDATLAGLVRALDDVLYPQANLCSSGRHKTITAGRVRELVAAFDRDGTHA